MLWSRFILAAILLIFADIDSGYFPKLRKAKKTAGNFAEADYFAMILVDAREFQTSTFQTCMSSLRQSQNEHNLFGHVWILLVDQKKGEQLECGYTGEGDATMPPYTMGLGLLLQGKISDKMSKSGADLRNPASYLFTQRDDGYLQWGNGGHHPNCAIAFPVTRCQFDQMVQFLSQWKEKSYCLQRANCVHFALKLVRFTNLALSYHPQRVRIPKYIGVGPHRVVLRRDRRFSTLKVSTPFSLRDSIERQFCKSDIDFALKWYAHHKG